MTEILKIRGSDMPFDSLVILLGFLKGTVLPENVEMVTHLSTAAQLTILLKKGRR